MDPYTIFQILLNFSHNNINVIKIDKSYLSKAIEVKFKSLT